MVILVIGGGLGNQMFEYAFARCVQERVQEKLYLDLHHIAYDSLRTYSLNHLFIDSNVVILNRFQSLLCRVDLRIRKRIIKLLSKNNNLQIYDKFGIYLSQGEWLYKYFGHTDSKLHIKYIEGNFQSERYFIEQKDRIVKELLVRDTIRLCCEELLCEIERCNSVCVHIRLGDYTKYAELNLCDFKYYTNGMKKILEVVNNPIFYIFSYDQESIQWIKKNYRFCPELNIKYVDMGNSDYEELKLMYSCKHFIISNSTFSWWASYLASNSDKLIIAPKRWNISRDDKDIYCKNWILV